jgi:hypothetical protein
MGGSTLLTTAETIGRYHRPAIGWGFLLHKKKGADWPPLLLVTACAVDLILPHSLPVIV